jgi:putative hydrolase of the HAD superfamily
MTGPVEAVLFDVEGVIAHRDDEATRAALDRQWPGLTLEAVQQVRNNDRLYPLWKSFSCGRLASSSYWAAVLADLGLEVTDAAVDEMRGIQEQTAWAVLDETVLDAVSALAADGDVRVGVLSNSSVDYDRHIGRFEDLFDVTCFSHRTGRRKPDVDAYRHAAGELGVPPASIVFFDDKTRNIKAASELGMRAVHVVGAESVTRELVALGLIRGER